MRGALYVNTEKFKAALVSLSTYFGSWECDKA